MNLQLKLHPLLCSLLLLIALAPGCSQSMKTEEPSFTNKYGHFSYCEMTVVKQSQSYSCGSACLTAVLNYWGIDTTESRLLEEFGSAPKQGFAISQLLKIARSENLAAYAFSMDSQPMEQLAEQVLKGRPVICIVKMPNGYYIGYDLPLFGHVYRKLSRTLSPRNSHFLVVFGIADDQLLIMDPALGFVPFSAGIFEEAWRQHGYTAILIARQSQSTQ
jgi:predicted double-glycine peptidase